jgi:hypothetical protein
MVFNSLLLFIIFKIKVADALAFFYEIDVWHCAPSYLSLGSMSPCDLV